MGVGRRKGKGRGREREKTKLFGNKCPYLEVEVVGKEKVKMRGMANRVGKKLR